VAAGASLVLAAGAGAAAPKTAVFNVAAVHAGPGMQVTVNSKVWVTPTQARADVKNPLQGEAIFLVNKGSFYQLDPKSKQYMKGPLPPEVAKSKDNFDMLVGKFAFDAGKAVKTAKKVRTETMSGFVCDVLTNSVSEGEGTRNLTIWMPQKMSPKFPVKAVVNEKVNKPGASMEQTITITLSNVKLNTAIPASTFAVPAGYKQATGKPQAPKVGK
jgi:outer membrane lipoprotein-sorting protein